MSAAKKKNQFKFRMRLKHGDAIAVGPGKIDLLKAVSDTGSITLAARKIGMSYRRAWLLIDEMNRCLKSPAVETATGGRQGGGSAVTATGHEILRLYSAIERRALRAAAADIRALSGLLSKK
jgi:molybdate transport system regulatory protein